VFKGRSVTRSTALLAVAAIVLVLGSGAAFGTSSPHCTHVQGRLVDQVQFAGPACAGSFFCVRGRATGSLGGDFVSTVTSVTPSQDAAVTSVAFLTADFVLNTRPGELTIKEAIAYNTAPGGGELADLGTVVAGTRDWQGATGRLVISGKLNFVDPSDVKYEGEVCRA
jgi:hypothetical protein